MQLWIVILILIVLYCLYKRRYDDINGQKEIDIYNIDIIKLNDVSRYTSFPDKPRYSTYMIKDNKTAHLYPFDEYSLYGLDDYPFKGNKI